MTQLISITNLLSKPQLYHILQKSDLWANTTSKDNSSIVYTENKLIINLKNTFKNDQENRSFKLLNQKDNKEINNNYTTDPTAANWLLIMVS